MPSPPAFLPGLRLSQVLYEDAVRPILQAEYPDLVHSAARLDCGSEVLGFDTPRSMDHGWGPKLGLFLSESEPAALHEALYRTLAERLPTHVCGFPTHFSDPDLSRAALQAVTRGPIRHGVEIHTPRSFFRGYLGLDPRDGLSTLDWLTLYEQRLRTVTTGAVYHDGLGALTQVRELLRYYPQDVWLYLMACQWHRIGQEEAFLGRAGDVGDELGSRLIGARLVWEVMRLCFLLEQTFAPYTKWFGTAFARLACGPALGPRLESVLKASSWPEREACLCEVYSRVAEMHNALGLTEPLPTQPSPFYDRPYRVIHADRFAEALAQRIADPEVRGLPLIGSANQFVDSTDVLDPADQLRKLQAVFR